jgi:PAS domain S-box-containing protein
VYCVAEDRAQRIWIGSTAGLQLASHDQATLSPRPILLAGVTPDAQPTVNAVVEDRSGNLWVATGVGLFRFDAATGTHERLRAKPGPEPGLGELAINALVEDGEGMLWAGTHTAGLIRFDPVLGTSTAFVPRPGDATSLSHPRVLSLAVDAQDRVYVGTENGGLNVLQPGARGFSRYLPEVDVEHSLNSGSVWAIFVDEQAVLWVGTYHGGLNVSAPFGARFEHLKARRGGLNDPKVASILEDHAGDLWIGTDGTGLNRVDAATGRYAYYRHDPLDDSTIGSDAVLALLEDSREAIWVGGWEAGLGRLDRDSGRVRRYRHDPRVVTTIRANSVWQILEMRSGGLLVVTNQGIDVFDPDTEMFTRLAAHYPGAGETSSYSALEDSRGNLWLGTNNGAERVDTTSGRVTLYRDEPETGELLAQGEVSTILEDRAGNVWFSTSGGLICLSASGGGLRRYTTEDGLPHINVRGVLEDDAGALWLGTNAGLSKLVDAVDVPAEPRFLSFDVHDGVQGRQFIRGSVHRGPSGLMYFGGTRGLNQFLPADVTQNPHIPPVVLTDLRIFNSSVTPGVRDSPLDRSITGMEELTLSHRHSVVTFEFAALNFILPEKNRYTYMLEGFDTDWSPASAQRSATYTNLPGGEYVFRVRGSNNDAIWNDDGVALRVHVTSPFWKTLWFWSALATLLTGCLVVAYRSRVELIRDHARELARQVEERTADLSDQVEVRRQTEQSLQAEVAERARAETATRALADELSSANEGMRQHQQALEQENDERRRAEEAAGRERDLLHALMDNIPDLIYFKDAEGRFTRINRAHAKALDLETPDLAEGKRDADFHDLEFARATRAEEREIIRTGEPLLGQLQSDVRTKRWYLATKVPIRGADGQITGLVGISKDITKRREAEARLEKDLDALLQIVSRAAHGDLTVRGEEGEETLGRIARAVNQMLEVFATILAEARGTALSVASASTQILATATQIARGAQSQSDEVHLTSSAVDEMASSMKQVALSVERSAEGSRSVLEHVETSDGSVQAVVDGMTRIDEAVENTASKMHLLEERSSQVFSMIELIQDVATQSKLLSLNAAIEAAHAGDAGRGFGVVADEIRRLAERSAEAIEDVTGFVHGIMADTQAALEAMQAGVKEVAQGRELSQRARASLLEISSLVKESVRLAAEISYSSREQVGAAQAAADSIQTVASITEDSAAGALETTVAVRGLVDLSEELNRTISRFKVHDSD